MRRPQCPIMLLWTNFSIGGSIPSPGVAPKSVAYTPTRDYVKGVEGVVPPFSGLMNRTRAPTYLAQFGLVRSLCRAYDSAQRPRFRSAVESWKLGTFFVVLIRLTEEKPELRIGH